MEIDNQEINELITTELGKPYSHDYGFRLHGIKTLNEINEVVKNRLINGYYDPSFGSGRNGYDTMMSRNGSTRKDFIKNLEIEIEKEVKKQKELIMKIINYHFREMTQEQKLKIFELISDLFGMF